MNNNEYNIKKIDGKYYLYLGDEQVMTPEESAICTTSERLAELLLRDAVEYGDDCEDLHSLISYHALYCDIANEPDEAADEENIEMFTNLLHIDPFWAFDEPIQIRAAALSQYMDWLPKHVNDLPLQCYAAYLNLMSATGSIILPYKILYNVLSDEGFYSLDDFDGLVEDLENYVQETGEAEDSEVDWSKESIKKMIETFITYYSLETV